MENLVVWEEWGIIIFINNWFILVVLFYCWKEMRSCCKEDDGWVWLILNENRYGWKISMVFNENW